MPHVLRYDRSVLRMPALVRVVFVGWLVIAGLFVVRLGGDGQDDFFITYRYARSVTQGDGLVFNPGERHFGATEPGLALALAGAHVVTRVPIPWLGTLSTALGLLICGLVLTAEGAARDRLVAAILGSTLVLGSTWIWMCHGAAAPMVLACLLLAGRLSDSRPEVAGLAAGAAVWLRPDAALGVLALGLIVWWQQRKLPWRFGVAAGSVILVGAGWAWLYFGSPLPSTLAAKRLMADWQPGTWPSGLEFWRVFLPGWTGHLGLLAPVLVIGGVAGWVSMWRRGGTATRLLAVNGAGLAVAYPLLGVPFYAWYVIPVIASWFLGLAYLLADVLRWIVARSASWSGDRRRLQRVEAATAVLLTLLVAVRVLPMVLGYQPAPHLEAYRQAAMWIRDTTPPEATVTYYEVGVVGWYSERPLRDLLGLVTPGASTSDFEAGLKEHPTEIVLDHTVRRVGNLPGSRWFRELYEPVARFPDAGGGEVVVHRRRTPAP